MHFLWHDQTVLAWLRVASACVLPSLGHSSLSGRHCQMCLLAWLRVVSAWSPLCLPLGCFLPSWVHSQLCLLGCIASTCFAVCVVLFCLFFVLNHCTGLPSQTRVGDPTVALSASKIILPTIVCCPRQPVCERLVACLSESFANKTQFNACPSLSFCLTWSVGSSDCNFGHDAGLGVFCRHCCRTHMFGLRISLMFHLQISNHV